MKTNKSSVIDFLQRDRSFIIPVYQRNYEWREEQCQRLFDDLLDLLPRVEQYKHFFGCVVCSGQSMSECIIIDGQQRLTTVSLLMLAMARMIEDGRLQPDDPRLARRLRDKYLTNDDDERQPKFRHSRDDAAAFCALFNGRNAPDNSRFTRNYSYFSAQLARENGYTPDQLFDAICGLEICVLELEQGDDPQLIFESLNSTGLSLSEGDKVRNYILMGITDPEQQQHWYEDYWQQIEGACTSADGNSALDAFLRDYLTVRTSTTNKQNRIYVACKKYCADCGDRLQVLRDLHHYAHNYRALLQGDTAIPELNLYIKRLNYLDTSVLRPYLLEVLEMHLTGKLTDEELLRIFNITESFVVRRFICGLAPTPIGKLLLTLHRKILREGEAGHAVYVDRLIHHLLFSPDIKVCFPNDAEFSQCLIAFKFTVSRIKRFRYLLERLENARTREQHEIYGKTYSVEHIMPQTLNDEWKRDLGPDHQAIHERWLHRIANLTLTAYNSEYSNCSFTRKRDMEHGFRDSGLRLNSYLARLERWDEAALQARQQRLLEDALAIWPYPASSILADRGKKISGQQRLMSKSPLHCIPINNALRAGC